MTYQQIPDPLPIAWNDTAAAVSIAANTTASGAVTSPGGSASYIVQLTGTWVATVQIQISRDGVNFVNVTSGNISNLGTGALVTSGNITANGVYQLNVAGIAAARVITTAYTSGTIVGAAAITPGVGASNVTIAGTTTISGTPGVLLGANAAFSPNSPISTWSQQFPGGGGTAAAYQMKSSAGRLYGLQWYNPNTAVAYLQYFFQLSPVVGTTSPFTVFPLAPGGGYVNLPYGFYGATNFQFACTTGRSNNVAPTLAVDLMATYL